MKISIYAHSPPRSIARPPRRGKPIAAQVPRLPFRTVRDLCASGGLPRRLQNVLMLHYYHSNPYAPNDSFAGFLSALRRPFNIHNNLATIRHFGLTSYMTLRDLLRDYL